MELKGKSIAFLGDSITQGVGVNDPKDSYVSVFEKLSGAAVDNFGVSATRIGRRKEPHPIASWNDCFLDRAERMTKNYDVIFVFGGTNDYANPNPTELGDINSDDEHTFYGALKALMEKLIILHPTATVVFATPIHREKENNYGIVGLTLRDYVNAIKQVAEIYSIPVLDLWSNAGIQGKVLEVMRIYLDDGLHPNKAGHRRIAERIYSFLKNL